MTSAGAVRSAATAPALPYEVPGRRGLRGWLSQHGALREGTDQALVDGEPAPLFGAGRRPQRAPAALELGRGDVQVGGAGRDVDADEVAVADQRERAATGRLRRHLPHHDALLDQAGQLAVGY